MKKIVYLLYLSLSCACFAAETANTQEKSEDDAINGIVLPTIPKSSATSVGLDIKNFEIPQAREMEVPTKGFEGVNVRVIDTLNALAHLAGINYIAPNVPQQMQTAKGTIPHPLYEDKITFSMGDTDPYKAFCFIARTKGYTVHKDDGIVYLTHPQLEAIPVMVTRSYVIKNVDARWMLEPVASLIGISLAKSDYGAMPDSNPAYPKSKEEGKNSGSNSNNSSGSSGGGNSSSSGNNASQGFMEWQTGEMNSRFQPAFPLAQPVFTGGYNGQASIFANRINNTLVVRATEAEHTQIAEFLKENDVKESQIQIDIKFIEVELTDRVQEGIDWSATLGNATFSMTPVSVDPNAFSSGVFDKTSWIFDPNAVIMNYPAAQATLRWLQTQKNAVLSSSPKIVTKSGVPAAIEATVLESIEVYTIVNTSGITQPVTSGTEQFATGVFMDIIATLTPSGHLQLNMNPTVSNKIGETVGSSGQVLPIISKRKATTTVTIRPSQTVVIGGLMQGGETYDDNKVPILGDIPYLGNLFKSSDTERKKTSLLIFVTASIVNSVYDTPPSEEEYEMLQREQKLRDTVDYKDRHGKGATGLVEMYDRYNQEKVGESAAKGKVEHDTADLPTMSPKDIKAVSDQISNEQKEEEAKIQEEPKALPKKPKSVLQNMGGKEVKPLAKAAVLPKDQPRQPQKQVKAPEAKKKAEAKKLVEAKKPEIKKASESEKVPASQKKVPPEVEQAIKSIPTLKAPAPTSDADVVNPELQALDAKFKAAIPAQAARANSKAK